MMKNNNKQVISTILSLYLRTVKQKSDREIQSHNYLLISLLRNVFAYFGL